MPNLSAPPPLSPPWVELPPEITANILQRLGAREILESAERVCSTWWKVCHEPATWSVVDLKYGSVNFRPSRVMENLCRLAVNRSQGQLHKISIDNFGDEDLINYIAQRSNKLRHLRLVTCYYTEDGCLAAAAKNFPLLEELHIYLSDMNKDDIEVIGQSCPLLNSFTLNACCFRGYQCNDVALAVARNMPKLRHLSLLGNVLTNEGLYAILDGCLHLQSLDIRHCFNINLEGDLGGRCKQQIIDLKLPHDSTDGYEFDAHVCDCSSLNEDYPDQITDYSFADDDFHWLSDTSLGHQDYDDYDGYYD